MRKRMWGKLGVLAVFILMTAVLWHAGGLPPASGEAAPRGATTYRVATWAELKSAIDTIAGITPVPVPQPVASARGAAGDVIEITGSIVRGANETQIEIPATVQGITIRGASGASIVIDGSAATPGADTRLFLLAGDPTAGASVTFEKLTLKGGKIVGDGSDGGGAVFVGDQATANFVGCTLTGNEAMRGATSVQPVNGGGAVYGVSGSSSGGTVTMTNCTLTGNVTDGDVGGGAVLAHNVTLQNCTVIGNRAKAATGVQTLPQGGGVRATSWLRLGGSIVAGNTAALGHEAGIATNNVSVSNPAGGTASSSSRGYNLFDGGIGTFAAAATDSTTATMSGIFGTSTPTLSENAGWVPTIAVVHDGPADNLMPSGYPAADARGTARPQHARASAGACECAVKTQITTWAELRGAVAEARAGDTITLDRSLARVPGQQSPDFDAIVIDKNLTIRGVGTGIVLDGKRVVSDASNSMLFRAAGGATARFENLTLTGGYWVDRGGAVHGEVGTTLDFTGCTITGNVALGAGGGVYGDRVKMTGCTVSNNEAKFADSGGGGGIYAGTLEMTGCTVSGNSSEERGGGVHATTAVLVNCTLAGNRAVEGGSTTIEESIGGGLYAEAATLTNCTVTGNECTNAASAGSGVYATDRLTLAGSIVAGNRYHNPVTGEYVTDNIYNAARFSFQSHGYNVMNGGLDGRTSPLQATDRPNEPYADIFAGNVLADNGGPVWTIKVKHNGRADNMIPTDVSWVPATDARGESRPGIFGKSCAGAYECYGGADAAVIVIDNDWQKLRKQIDAATAGSTVTLAAGAAMAAGETEIVIGKNLTITGAPGTTLDGKGMARLFRLTGGAKVTFAGLTLTGGKASGGGAILAETGTALALVNCTITGNTAAGNNSNGGGICAYGTLSLTNCTVYGNTTTGINGEGGGLFADGTATLTNCTVTGNRAAFGAGGVRAGTLALRGSIVAGNSAGEAANKNIYVHTGSTSGGYNVVDGGAENFTFAATDVKSAAGLFADGTGASPKDNGGPVPTIKIAHGGPADNKIPAAAWLPQADARGVPRPADGSTSSIGAYECAGDKLIVSLAPLPGGPAVACAAPDGSPNAWTMGQAPELFSLSQYIKATAFGTAPYRYAWRVTVNGRTTTPSSTGDTLGVSRLLPGAFVCTATVTDGAGRSATSPALTMYVTEPPKEPAAPAAPQEWEQETKEEGGAVKATVTTTIGSSGLIDDIAAALIGNTIRSRTTLTPLDATPRTGSESEPRGSARGATVNRYRLTVEATTETKEEAAALVVRSIAYTIDGVPYEETVNVAVADMKQAAPAKSSGGSGGCSAGSLSGMWLLTLAILGVCMARRRA